MNSRDIITLGLGLQEPWLLDVLQPSGRVEFVNDDS